MSTLSHPLMALAATGRAAAAPILQTCRLDGLASPTYGRLEIAERAHELVLESPELYAADDFAVVVGQVNGRRAALAADLYNGKLGRLWWVGPRPLRPHRALLEVAAPFDPDLHQARAFVGFEPSTHPELAAGAAETLKNILDTETSNRSVAVGALPRARFFVLRAVSVRSQNDAVALVAIVFAGDCVQRFPARCLAVMQIGAEGATWTLGDPETPVVAEGWLPRA